LDKAPVGAHDDEMSPEGLIPITITVHPNWAIILLDIGKGMVIYGYLKKVIVLVVKNIHHNFVLHLVKHKNHR